MFLKYKKIKKQNIYEKLCVIVIKIIGGDTIQIKVGKDYLNFDLKKNEEYLVSSFQLRKCNEQTRDNLVNSK